MPRQFRKGHFILNTEVHKITASQKKGGEMRQRTGSGEKISNLGLFLFFLNWTYTMSLLKT